MEENLNPTAEEVLAELNNSADGKIQLELAALRVLVAKQQAYITGQNEASATDTTEED